jgi:hypothetical protein
VPTGPFAKKLISLSEDGQMYLFKPYLGSFIQVANARLQCSKTPFFVAETLRSALRLQVTSATIIGVGFRSYCPVGEAGQALRISGFGFPHVCDITDNSVGFRIADWASSAIQVMY